MSLFMHKDFDDHEQVCYFTDADSGLMAIVAIHNSTLGPALGGCRMYPYSSDADALTDVLRLSRGMSYKSAMAGLPLGGGKSVIIGDPRVDKSEQLLRAFGRCLEQLGGRYIAAEDSGTGVDDIRLMAEETRHVSGIHDKPTADGGTRSGDPSPATAYGTFVGLKAAVQQRLGHGDLTGLKVAVQGVGNVGFRLGRYLKEAGAELWVTDVFEDNLCRAAEELGATPVGTEEIFDLDVDVFAPCALGAAINDDSLPRLRAAVVAGAANNQLAEDRHGLALLERGILYAPDYVINAGGIIDVCYEREGRDHEALVAHVEGIADTLSEVFVQAESDGLPTQQVADRIAEQRFAA